MKKDIKPTDKEYLFFQDFWKFYKEYHDPEESEEWWDKLIHAASDLVEKYKDTDFYDMANSIVIHGVIRGLENKHRRAK